MAENFTIRAATMDDYDGLCALYLEADALHHKATPDAFAAPADPPRSREFIAETLADANSALFVAVESASGAIVGFVRLALRPAWRYPVPAQHDAGWVEELVVKRDNHRSGIGSALMAHAQRWFRGRGASDFRLTVWEFNRGAIGFYERLGYETLMRTMRLREPRE
jgi:ribosomal protein S18 acetylase RimI-like enzyme